MRGGFSLLSDEREGGAEEGDKKKKIEPSGSIRLNRLHPKPTANHPRQPPPVPYDPQRLRRERRNLPGDAGARIARGVRVARQPFALSSTTVMDRTRLRPYHHHHHQRHVTTTWRGFKLLSHHIGTTCHVCARRPDRYNALLFSLSPFSVSCG